MQKCFEAFSIGWFFYSVFFEVCSVLFNEPFVFFFVACCAFHAFEFCFECSFFYSSSFHAVLVACSHALCNVMFISPVPFVVCFSFLLSLSFAVIPVSCFTVFFYSYSLVVCSVLFVSFTKLVFFMHLFCFICANLVFTSMCLVMSVHCCYFF